MSISITSTCQDLRLLLLPPGPVLHRLSVAVMSAAIAALAASYGSGSGSESDSDSEGGRCSLPAADSLMHLTKSSLDKPSLAVAVDSAPEVAVKVSALATGARREVSISAPKSDSHLLDLGLPVPRS